MMEDGRVPLRASAGARRRRPEKSQRTRYRLACARCQRRKIKCDDQLPECANCKAAGEICIDGESSRLGPLRDNADIYIAKLQNRIRCLEALVRSHLPEVDLSKLHLTPHGHDHGCDSNTPASHSESISASTSHVDTSPTLVMDETTLASEPPTTADARTSRNLYHGLPIDEIGLMSLNGTPCPRYIGPSSGHFLLRMLITTGSSQSRQLGTTTALPMQPQNPPALPTALVQSFHGPLPLPSPDNGMKMLAAFFDLLHPLYPISDEAALVKSFEDLHRGYGVDKYSIFQVFMVLAIGAVLLSHRHRVRLPSESYCLSALQHFEDISMGGSVQGLQCLLLLQLYTMYCPQMKLNTWYLNYQCLAATIDLGLQKNLGSNCGIAPAEQDLRTRLFWVVMTLDRKIAIMMGRPIGLRDEACDLRMPLCGEETNADSDPGVTERRSHDSGMMFSAHLFRLTQLKTEYKYVANSIVRDPPSHAYPGRVDYLDWQQDLVRRIDQWISTIPLYPSQDQMYLGSLALVEGLNLKIATLRPSLAIPAWTPGSASESQEAAHSVLKIFDQLYRDNLLVHSWDTMHSITLAVITLLCGARVAPSLCNPERILLSLDVGLRLLSACGEHWSGAKRCRDIIEELGRPLVHDITRAHTNSHGRQNQNIAQPSNTSTEPGVPCHNVSTNGGGTIMPSQTNNTIPENWLANDLPSSIFGDFTDNMDSILQYWFEGVVSTYPEI